MKIPYSSNQYITNYKIDNKIHMIKVNFNNMPLSLCNSIRRILLSEIPIFGLDIDDEKADVLDITNNTPVHNEYLLHRLGLIPIHYQNIEQVSLKSKWNSEKGLRDYNIDDSDKGTNTFLVDDGCVKKNTTNVNKTYIATNNYLEKVFSTGTSANTGKKSYVVQIPNASPNEYFKIGKDNIGLTVGCGIDNSRFSPVSYISWDFHDPEKVYNYKEERNFELSDTYESDPKNIWMKLKSDHMEPYKLYGLSIYVLKQKLEDIKNYKLENDNWCYFLEDSYKYDSIIMKIKNENDTLGNVISSMGKEYLIKNKGLLNYISYKITHPLEYDIIVKISINENDKDIFTLAKDRGLTYLNNDDDERYRLYKELCKIYMKELIKYILDTFFEKDNSYYDKDNYFKN